MYILVHSRGASDDAKYLSSFTPCVVTWRNKTYPSVENAFQAAKLSYLQNESDNLEALYKQFTSVSSAEAKKLGTATSFKKHGIILDKKIWNQNSINIMKELLITRYNNDSKFASLLEKYDKFYHFERSGNRSFWGGYFEKESGNFVGQNMYGKLLKNIPHINE